MIHNEPLPERFVRLPPTPSGQRLSNSCILLFFIWGVYVYGDGIRPLTGKYRRVYNFLLQTLMSTYPPLKTSKKRLFNVPWYLKYFTRGIRIKNNKSTFIWNWWKISLMAVLITITVVTYFVFPFPVPVFVGAVIDSTASGNYNIGGTWVGGVAPGAGDDARIMNTHNVSLAQAETCGSMEIRNGGTLTGAGFELTCFGENGAGFAFDHDGTIGGALDVFVTTNAITQVDLTGTAGSVNNLHINTAGGQSVTFNGNTNLDGTLTLTTGPFLPSANGDTLTVAVNIQIGSTLGAAGWTGTITLGGDWNDAGTYTHGNQTVDFDNGGAKQTILTANNLFYNITVSGQETEVVSGVNVNADNQIQIDAGSIFTLAGNNALTVGTAAASGTIANAGTFQPGDGTTVHAHPGDPTEYLNLTGAGVYDWDYGTGDVNWGFLNHKGTHATAKTTGGGGVTITLDDRCDFFEDFTIATNDTLDFNDVIIGIKKDFTVTGTQSNGAEIYLLSAGTGVLSGFAGTNLFISSDLEYSFAGTNAFTGAVAWDGGVGDLLAYDATSILNVSGGITVPATAYLGADSSGDMGDNNDVSGWTADMSWGWLNNSGDTTFTSGTTTISSHTGNVAIANSDTLIHNSGIIKFTGTALQQVNTNGDDLYRVDNSNTAANVEFITSNFSLNGIWWRTSTTTEADTIDVTLAGFTPALGTTGPFTHDELESDGLLLESNGGSFIFDHPLPEEIGLDYWRVLRGASEADVVGHINVEIIDSIDQYEKSASLSVDDTDGLQGSNWTEGDIVKFLYHDGTSWITRWVGYCVDIDDKQTRNPTTSLEFKSFDWWLRTRKISMSFTDKNYTLHQVLEYIITYYTPASYVAANVDTDSNPAALQPVFQGITPEEAISQILEESDNEEFGINNDQEFYVQQRATSKDGTRDAPGDIDDDDYYEYEISRISSEEINRMVLYYGSSGDEVAVSEDRTRQTSLQSRISSSKPVVNEKETTRTDITDSTLASSTAAQMLNSTTYHTKIELITWLRYSWEPGMVTTLTIADKSAYTGGVDVKIYSIIFRWPGDKTILNLIKANKLYRAKGTSHTGDFARGIDNIGKSSNKTSIQIADTSWGTQSTKWDTQAELDFWNLGANCATNVGGYIEASGATVGAEVNTSPWVLAADIDSYWWLAQGQKTDNDGVCVIQVEGSVTGIVVFSDPDKWEDIEAAFGVGENVRLNITLNWDGAGTSPRFSYGAIRWK